MEAAATATATATAASAAAVQAERRTAPRDKSKRSGRSKAAGDPALDEFEIFRRQSLHGGRTDGSLLKSVASQQEDGNEKSEGNKEKFDRQIVESRPELVAGQRHPFDNQRRFTVHVHDTQFSKANATAKALAKATAKFSLVTRRSVDRLLPNHARIVEFDSDVDTDSELPANVTGHLRTQSFSQSQSQSQSQSHATSLLIKLRSEDVKVCHLNTVLKSSWCPAIETKNMQSTFSTKPVLKSKGKRERSFSVPKSVAFDLKSDGHGKDGGQTSLTSFRPFCFAMPATYYVQVLGAASVGKSTLCSQICAMVNQDLEEDGADDSEVEPESELAKPRRISVVMDGEESNLIFLQAAPKHENTQTLIISGVHAYLVVYAIDDLTSYQYASALLESILVNNDMKTATVLVANKSDLARCKEVQTEDGKALAYSYSCSLVETSATLQHRIEDLLIEVLKQIRLSIARQTQFALQTTTESTPLTSDYFVSDAGDVGRPKRNIFGSLLRRLSRHK